MYVTLIYFPGNGNSVPQTHGIWTTLEAAREHALRFVQTAQGTWYTDQWYEGTNVYGWIVLKINRHSVMD